ncbi:MAG TPA: cyclase family protein [Gemmatimonadota bacterium]|nr:cyclase family protein [Gemmatimonadota bacterium]
MAASQTLRSIASAVVLATALGPRSAGAQGPTGIPVDLTHPFDETTIYWPTAEPFRLTVEAEGVNDAGFWYAASSFCASEHGGTHLDAPVHFAEGRRSAAEIPLEDLMGPAVVIGVEAPAAADPDHLVSVADLAAWEARHGPIPTGSIVLLKTGWGARWPDAGRYLGTAGRGPEAVAELSFPGLDPEAARWLLAERDPKAVGIDTASIDRGRSTDFLAHRVLADADVPIFENVANLDRLPPTGAWVIALPMKIGRGTGGPLRIVALLPE